MCILYWQGRDYKTQETWAQAQYLIWHKWTLRQQHMPCVWLGHTSGSAQHEQNGSEVSHGGVQVDGFIWGSTARGGELRASCITAHLPPEAPVPAPALPAPGQCSSQLWLRSWGLARDTAPSHEYQGSTRTTQHKDGAKLINLAYKGWQHIRKSKCTHLVTRVEDKDIHPEQQIVSNTTNTSRPTGRKLAWFYT